MTEQELIIYFETATLPEVLRINRAIIQYDVEEAVERNIEMMLRNPKDDNARHRLADIRNTLEHPYDGPDIPKR